VNANGGVNQTGTGLNICSGVNALSVPSGTDWQSATTGTTELNLQLPPQYQQGFYRVIACGFEVTNTTSELYKGGTVTVYKSPANSGLSNLLSQDGSTNYAVKLGTLPPTTQSTAALFPNSKTWGATDGVYIMETVNSPNIPYTCSLPGTSSGLILNADLTTMLSNNGVRTTYLPRWLGGSGATGSVSPGLSSPMYFDISGAIFSGLNSNTSLQVTAKYVVERVPNTTDPNLLVLARIPPTYDMMALELYSRIVDQLPVGVKVGMNPLGEWFFDILQVLAATAPAVGAALSPVMGPLGPALGAAAGIAGTAALQHRKNKQQKKLPPALPPRDYKKK
jgi:hypothetical protein